jgi:hypothetical protein
MPPYIHCLAAVMLLGACRSSTPSAPVPVVDLIHELPRADERPLGRFAVGEHRIGGVSHAAIAAPVPSRLTVSLPLPRRGVLRAFVAVGEAPLGIVPAPVRVRRGVSDDRIYEGLIERVVAPGGSMWTDLRADLSAYAGWKWSLFYRPDSMTWRVVLAADATGAAPATVFWGSPEVVTDTQSAREYAVRRQRFR